MQHLTRVYCVLLTGIVYRIAGNDHEADRKKPDAA